MESLARLNKALLDKWSWRYANEKKKAFWNKVIRGKYEEEQGGWRFQEGREGYDVSLWKAIKKLRHLATSRFSFTVGNW